MIIELRKTVLLSLLLSFISIVGLEYEGKEEELWLLLDGRLNQRL